MKKYGLLIFSLVFFAFGAFFFWNSQRPNRQASTNEVPPVSLNRAPSAQGNESELNGFIFAMKNKAAVDVNIKKIIAYAKVHPENEAAQLYAIFAQPIPLFKGIAWRLRMLVEPIDAAYIGTISWLRAIKRNNDRRAPHLDALFDYFTDPNPGENIQGQTGLFTSLAQFQDYMATKVSPVVYAQIKSCDAILKAHKNHNEPLFMFDAALIFGDEAGSQMTSQTQRDRKFMPGNLTAIMANMYERMGFGMYLASYNMEGLARFLNTLTAQSFFAKKSDFKKGIISNVFDIHLQSPKEISHVLSKPEFSQFLTLRQPEGPKYLKKSLEFLRAGVKTRITAFNEMEALARQANQKEYFVNADFITSRPAITLAALQKRQRLLSADGPETFNDRVTNTSFKLNISALFDAKNSGITDLKKLFPRSGDFKNDPEKIGNDPRTFKWNYEYGSAKNWPDVTFAGLLPETSGPDQFRSKLISVSRDASTPALQSWLRLFM